jgi:hypothetical protein
MSFVCMCIFLSLSLSFRLIEYVSFFFSLSNHQSINTFLSLSLAHFFYLLSTQDEKSGLNHFYFFFSYWMIKFYIIY